MPAASKELDEYHGEVLTRRWVVDFILDQAGYTPDCDLGALHFVEPAAGTGAFVLPALERLSASLRECEKSLKDAYEAFRAFEIQARNVETLQPLMVKVLVDDGWAKKEATAFVKESLINADYLLTPHFPNTVDVIVGNPPYIRLEAIGERADAYRRVSPAMGGRADIYIAFYDLGLDTLTDDGRLVFICADRWMRNDYGRKLRRKVIDGFSMDLVLTMHDADAFEEEVSAYPAITVMTRGRQGRAILATADEHFNADGAMKLSKWAQRPSKPLVGNGVKADTVPAWFPTDQSWPEGLPARLAWLEHLNETLPLAEETGIRFGIGVATGNDKAYVVKGDLVPDIEPERLLPLLVADDIRTGELLPTHSFLVNPWDPNGLVNLKDWPRFAAYLEGFPELKDRHTAKASPTKWHKTIDRVNFDLLYRPKLVFQDMKGKATPVFHEGGLYPHHNLYWAVAEDDSWDIQVFGGLMLSEVVEAQVAAYCVKMRGGTLRFQTQYLRRVRVPHPKDIHPETAEALKKAFQERDREAATRAALDAYGMDALPD